MAPTSNKRRLPRASKMRDAILVAGRGRPEYKCTITDITEGGAGIRIANSAAVPDSVFLISLQDRRAFASMVMWRKLNALGLKFVSVIELSKTAPGVHDFLTRIWMERSR